MCFQDSNGGPDAALHACSPCSLAVRCSAPSPPIPTLADIRRNSAHLVSPKHPQLNQDQGHLRPYYSCAQHNPAPCLCILCVLPPITAMSTRSIPPYVRTLPHTYDPPPRLPNPQGFATREVDQRMPFWQKDLQSRSVPNAVPGNQGMLLPGQNPPNTQTTPMADTTPRLRSGTGR